ncbi:MAG: hypothetical protein JNL70_18895 [Saprospiraceae bacterium]|nr:hypothetical protein [Saprospiraceae bacterium]
MSICKATQSPPINHLFQNVKFIRIHVAQTHERRSHICTPQYKSIFESV